jgi:hypothetical protein
VLHARFPHALERILPSPGCGAQVGWKHQGVVAELEAKRKAKSAKFYEAKKKLVSLRAKAAAKVEGA